MYIYVKTCRIEADRIQRIDAKTPVDASDLKWGIEEEWKSNGNC